jgi:hypothetical protein
MGSLIGLKLILGRYLKSIVKSQSYKRYMDLEEMGDILLYNLNSTKIKPLKAP